MNRERAKDIFRKNTMLLALILVMVLFQIMIVQQGKGSMFAPTNITNLINQNSYVVILATGMLMCIITGGNIDLSVGSVVALIGAVAGVMVVNMGLSVPLTIVVCLLLSTAIGAWQAFWIAYMRIPPFIVTLAGMLTFRGVAWIVLGSKTISPFPPEYSKIFSNYLSGNAPAIVMAVAAVICLVFVFAQVFSRVQRKKKNFEVEPLWLLASKLVLVSAAVLAVFWLLSQNKGIPVILILLAAIVLIYAYYTQNTVAGRHLYAFGGNEKAAKLSGINTNRTMFFAYTNMGFLSGVAALVCVARFNSAAPSAGDGYEMDAIASCFIGGASAYGGTGTVSGAVIGAIFMGVLNNGMSIMGIDQNWQRTVKGLVLLAAVIFDVVNKRRTQST